MTDIREYRGKPKQELFAPFIHGWYFYSRIENKHYIIVENKKFGLVKIEVIPETVGQYTGLKDRNGNKIYVGDIVQRIHVALVEGDTNDGKIVGIDSITYSDSELCYTIGKGRLGTYVGWECCLEIIGNIHDNPELLKRGNK